MLEPFSLTQSRCARADSSLQEELCERTGSEQAASGILRSIARYGSDPTILRYEISPRSNPRSPRDAATVAWSVRAVRAEA